MKKKSKHARVIYCNETIGETNVIPSIFTTILTIANEHLISKYMTYNVVVSSTLWSIINSIGLI